jgi:uncharacterized protein (DUF1697 family)
METVQTYVALLRSVNLGRTRKLPMTDLRAWLAELGCRDVRTYLQSGNAVFASDRGPEELELEIAKRLGERLGFDVPCMIRTPDQMRRIVAGNPFLHVATDHVRLAVAFLSGPPDRSRLATVDPATYQPELFQLAEHEIYLWYPGSIHRSRLNRELDEQYLRVTATLRNWNTVVRVTELATS